MIFNKVYFFCISRNSKKPFMLNIPNTIFPLKFKGLEKKLKEEKINKNSKTMNFQTNKMDITYCIEKYSLNKYYLENKHFITIEDKIKLLSVYNFNLAMLPIIIDDLFDQISIRLYNSNISLLVNDEDEVTKRTSGEVKNLKERLNKYNIDIENIINIVSFSKKETIHPETLFKLYYITLDIIVNTDLLNTLSGNRAFKLIRNLLYCELNDFKKGEGKENTYYRYYENLSFLNIIDQYLASNLDKFQLNHIKLILVCFKDLYYLPIEVIKNLMKLISNTINISKNSAEYMFFISYLLEWNVINENKALLNNINLFLLNLKNSNTTNTDTTNENIKSICDQIKIYSYIIYNKTADFQFLYIKEFLVQIINYLISSSKLRFSEMNDNVFALNAVYDSIKFFICLFYKLEYNSINKDHHQIDKSQKIQQLNEIKRILIEDSNIDSDRVKQVHILMDILTLLNPIKSIFTKKIKKSKFQSEVENVLLEEEIIFESDKNIETVSVDIFIPQYKLCIALNGIYHYNRNLPIIKCKELIKYSILEESGYRVRVINSFMFRNLDTVQNKKRYLLGIIKEVTDEIN